MDISIVSGTYNRKDSLIRMVNSARNSINGFYGLRYDFVIVDGGSDDGTIEWCRQQNDIFLIEHGELRGAVRAFNDGCYAAEADYIVLANDDIEFLGDTIALAYLYMQDHLECGIGCFYQDRERQHYPDDDPSKWYVAEMPCVENGRQVWRPYGQVCMVPKWLGDHVGWWGNYLHTYGGDNELSSKVYELGYRVSPIPGTKISDYEIRDGLRHVNNFGHGIDPKRTGGYHPDSKAWGTRWQFANRRDTVSGQILTGPTIQFTPIVDGPSIERKNRVVYLPIYEQGWAVQKEQKRGLREALVKHFLVHEFDYIQSKDELGKEGMLQKLKEILNKIQPSLLLTQIHNGEIINSSDLTDLKKEYPFIKIVNWNGDFWPDNLLSKEGIEIAKHVDLQLTVNRDALEKYKAMGINANYWQIGWEPDGVGYPPNTFCDVVFLASGYSQSRQNLVKQLRELNVEFHLYGPAWREGWSRGVTIYDFRTGCSIYQGAKISIGDSQWPETGFVSNRVFQALVAGGSALAHQWFKDMDKLGLIDGETCIIWKSFDELKRKIEYYLTHEEERKRIAEAGQNLALTRHSFEVRVQELLEMIEIEEEGWR